MTETSSEEHFVVLKEATTEKPVDGIEDVDVFVSASVSALRSTEDIQSVAVVEPSTTVDSSIVKVVSPKRVLNRRRIVKKKPTSRPLLRKALLAAAGIAGLIVGARYAYNYDYDNISNQKMQSNNYSSRVNNIISDLTDRQVDSHVDEGNIEFVKAQPPLEKSKHNIPGFSVHDDENSDWKNVGVIATEFDPEDYEGGDYDGGFDWKNFKYTVTPFGHEEDGENITYTVTDEK